MREAPSISVHRNVPIATWLGLLFLLFYIASARGTLSFGDDFSMLCVTRSIATMASVAVPSTAPGARRGVNGRYYSKFGLGQSALAVPFYLIGSFVFKRFNPATHQANPAANPIVYSVCMLGILTGAGTVFLLYLTCITLAFRQFASIASAIAFGCCTFAWFYARTLMTEPTSTFFLLLAFYGSLRYTNVGRWSGLFISGIALAIAILVRLLVCCPD
jgi:Dolichyl-phosphate-mannose-protein mannosyltransferase